MEKLQTQEVYIPVETVTEFRLQFRKSNVLIEPSFKFLEKSDKYLFSKEEIIKLVGDAFGAGRAYQKGEYNEYHGGNEHTNLNKQTYIDNLFK